MWHSEFLRRDEQQKGTNDVRIYRPVVREKRKFSTDVFTAWDFMPCKTPFVFP